MKELSKKFPIYREKILVLPSDADEFQHANNTRYVHWMQQVATAHSAALGWDAERYLKIGAIWVARRHIIDYIRPVYPGETMLAETWVPEMKNVSSIRKYRFTRLSDSALIAEAETRWGFVLRATGRPTRVPDELKTLFTEVLHLLPEPTSDAECGGSAARSGATRPERTEGDAAPSSGD